MNLNKSKEPIIISRASIEPKITIEEINDLVMKIYITKENFAQAIKEFLEAKGFKVIDEHRT
jgi:hypothetical protein